MKKLWMILFIILVFGCTKVENVPNEFVDGELVCAKIGGPIGMVYDHGYTHPSGSMEWSSINVRFYQAPISNNMQIGVGGSGLVSGGSVKNHNGGFYSVRFERYELLHERDCVNRK